MKLLAWYLAIGCLTTIAFSMLDSSGDDEADRAMAAICGLVWPAILVALLYVLVFAIALLPFLIIREVYFALFIKNKKKKK